MGLTCAPEGYLAYLFGEIDTNGSKTRLYYRHARIPMPVPHLVSRARKVSIRTGGMIFKYHPPPTEKASIPLAIFSVSSASSNSTITDHPHLPPTNSRPR